MLNSESLEWAVIRRRVWGLLYLCATLRQSQSRPQILTKQDILASLGLLETRSLTL